MTFEEQSVTGSDHILQIEKINKTIKCNSEHFPKLGDSKTCSSPRVKSRAFAFHNIYMNGLPSIINALSEPIIFADDNSIIISSKNVNGFCAMSN
jgi:hypothetical protein